jgi:hypothetical protein
MDILGHKHQFKVREGFDLSSVRILQRILEIPSSLGFIAEDFMRQTLTEIHNRAE